MNSVFSTHAFDSLDSRAMMSHEDLLKLLDGGKAVFVGEDKPRGRKHWLVYSFYDKQCFVVVRNEKDKEIITVLRTEYYHQKIVPEADRIRARELADLSPEQKKEARLLSRNRRKARKALTRLAPQQEPSLDATVVSDQIAVPKTSSFGLLHVCCMIWGSLEKRPGEFGLKVLRFKWPRTMDQVVVSELVKDSAFLEALTIFLKTKMTERDELLRLIVLLNSKCLDPLGEIDIALIGL